MLLFGGFILVPLAKLTHSISLLLYWYLPYKLAKFYTEYEPHGKKMHVFIGDYLIYFWDFKLNQKAIYHEDRVEPVEEIVFEKQIYRKGGPMSITLSYPIRETHENLALKKIERWWLITVSPILPSPLQMKGKRTNIKSQLLR